MQIIKNFNKYVIYHTQITVFEGKKISYFIIFHLKKQISTFIKNNFNLNF